MSETPRRLTLIAHRGGVVDGSRSENSFKALEEAIKRGYTHVEIDARITSDGHVVCFHNDSLFEEAGVDGRISEMARDDVTQVVLTRSGERIPTFNDYCARCTGQIGVMIDLKGCLDASIDSYTRDVQAALREHGLLDNALILINKVPRDNQDRIAQRFAEMSRVSWRQPLSDTQAAVRRDPGLPANHYVFNHGKDFSKADITGYHELGLDVIASINHHHYPEDDPIVLGRQHIEQLSDWGVDGFQIDSCYDPSLLPDSV